MRICSYILFQSICIATRSTAQGLDTLDKYSYPIYLQNEMGIFAQTGSGCFYKANNRVYVISNFHIITGWNAMNNTRWVNVKGLAIKFYNRRTKVRDSFLFVPHMRRMTIQ